MFSVVFHETRILTNSNIKVVQIHVINFWSYIVRAVNHLLTGNWSKTTSKYKYKYNQEKLTNRCEMRINC